jgi:EAL domain-containing protein (putative c-di-GMP-specific phosphodiesterase class I)
MGEEHAVAQQRGDLGLDGDGEYDPSIVDAIISLARAMALNVVAEGVETRGELDPLQRLRADRSQGYLWTKPLPTADVRAWLAAALWGPQPEWAGGRTT